MFTYIKFLYPVFILVSLSSCFTQMNITKSKEPISETTFKKMKPGKVYTFHFKDQYIYKVKIESISDSIVAGETKLVYHEHIWRGELPVNDKIMAEKQKEPFVYRYDDIQEKINKITTRKFNPVLTTLGVGGLLTITLGIISMNDPNTF
jgi:hypothetical protein